MQIEDLADEIDRVREAVGEVVVGYDDVVTDLLVGLISGGHVLLVGVPGVAKTTLAKAFARATGMAFGRVQFTQDMLPADITGHYYYDRSSEAFEVRKGAVFANLLLADEINRAPPKTQSALLEAMQEGQVTIEGDTFPLPSPFLVVATLNPVDVEGVYHLPEAQLDRFTLRTTMEYLDSDTERAMLAHNARQPGEADEVLSADRIEAAQEAAQRVHVGDPIIDYIQAIGEATRHHPSVELGASPRAMEQLMQAARAHALVQARDYAIPEDVQRVAERVLAHRLILDVDAEVEGKTDVGIVREVVEDTPIPKGIEARTSPPSSPAGTGGETTQASDRAEPLADPALEQALDEDEPGDEANRHKQPPAPSGPNGGLDGPPEHDPDEDPPRAADRAEDADAEEEPAGDDAEADGDDEDDPEEDRSSVRFKVKDIFDDW